MITEAQLADISGWLKEHGADDSGLPLLRQAHPDMHFSWCMDDDIGVETPVLESEAFNLYLVDGRDHCLQFTTDSDIATGVLIAEVTED